MLRTGGIGTAAMHNAAWLALSVVIVLGYSTSLVVGQGVTWNSTEFLYAAASNSSFGQADVDFVPGVFFSDVLVGLECEVTSFRPWRNIREPDIIASVASSSEALSQSVSEDSGTTVGAIQYHYNFELKLNSSTTPDTQDVAGIWQTGLPALFVGAEVIISSVTVYHAQSASGVYGGSNTASTGGVVVVGSAVWAGFSNASAAINYTSLYNSSSAMIAALIPVTSSTAAQSFLQNITSQTMNKKLVVELYMVTSGVLSSGLDSGRALNVLLSGLRNLADLRINSSTAIVRNVAITVEPADPDFADSTFAFDDLVTNECTGALTPILTGEDAQCSNSTRGQRCQPLAACLPRVKTPAHQACESLSVAECRGASSCMLIASDLAPLFDVFAGYDPGNLQNGFYSPYDYYETLTQQLYNTWSTPNVTCVHPEVVSCLSSGNTPDRCGGFCRLQGACVVDRCPPDDPCCGYSESQCNADKLSAEVVGDCQYRENTCRFVSINCTYPDALPKEDRTKCLSGYMTSLFASEAAAGRSVSSADLCYAGFLCQSTTTDRSFLCTACKDMLNQFNNLTTKLLFDRYPSCMPAGAPNAPPLASNPTGALTRQNQTGNFTLPPPPPPDARFEGRYGDSLGQEMKNTFKGITDTLFSAQAECNERFNTASPFVVGVYGARFNSSHERVCEVAARDGNDTGCLAVVGNIDFLLNNTLLNWTRSDFLEFCVREQLLPWFGVLDDVAADSPLCKDLNATDCSQQPGCFMDSICIPSGQASDYVVCDFFKNETQCTLNDDCMWMGANPTSYCDFVHTTVLSNNGYDGVDNVTQLCTLFGECMPNMYDESGCQGCIDFLVDIFQNNTNLTAIQAADGLKDVCLSEYANQGSRKLLSMDHSNRCIAKAVVACDIAPTAAACDASLQCYTMEPNCTFIDKPTCDQGFGWASEECAVLEVCADISQTITNPATTVSDQTIGAIANQICSGEFLAQCSAGQQSSGCTACVAAANNMLQRMRLGSQADCPIDSGENVPLPHELCLPFFYEQKQASGACADMKAAWPLWTASYNRTTYAYNFTTFCHNTTLDRHVCENAFGPMGFKAMLGGWYSENADGLEEWCLDTASLQTHEDYVNEWRYFMCDPSKSCCPRYGAVPTETVCENQSGCQYDFQCSVAKDPCYEDFMQSTSGYCRPGCTEVPALNTTGIFAPHPYSQTLCINETLWDICGSNDSPDSCEVLGPDGRNLCASQPRCAPPPSSDFKCDRDADPCCISTTTARFTNSTKNSCTASHSMLGLTCAVQSRCAMVADPCRDMDTEPWSCLRSNDTCQWVPVRAVNASTTFGGQCISKRDTCKGLLDDECMLADECDIIDRCVTDFCPPGDECCANYASDPVNCQANDCTAQAACLPKVDPCESNTNATTCRGLCTWSNATGTCNVMPEFHPCWMEDTVGDCEASAEQCYAVPICYDACTECESCVKRVYDGFVSRVLTITDPFVVTNNFTSWCHSQGYQNYVCSAVATTIVTSYQGGFAKRPAALCQLLEDECNVDDTCVINSPRSQNVSLPVDLCGTDGTNATAIPPVIANTTAGQCEGDFQCTGTQRCLFRANDTAVCGCEDGQDDCASFGTCTPFCSLPYITREITEKSSLLMTCGPDNNYACQSGLQCDNTTASVLSQCYVYTCNATASAVTGQRCGAGVGLCVAASPSLEAAVFMDDGTGIIVTLSSQTTQVSASCDRLFNDATMANLGLSYCYASGSQLEIYFLGVTYLTVNSTLQLSSSQTLLSDIITGRPFNTSTVSIASCSDCQPPEAVIIGPPTVVKACNGTTKPADFDGSYSFDPSFQPLKNATWSLTTATNDATFTSNITSTNNQESIYNKLFLRLGMGTVAADTTYTLTLTVTNFLGQTDSVSYIFEVQASGTIPGVGIVGANPTKFVISQGFTLAGVLDPNTVCSESPAVHYSWACTGVKDEAGAVVGGSCPLVIPSSAASKLVLSVPNLIMGARGGYTYTMQLSSRFGNRTAGTTAVDLYAVSSPLKPSLVAPLGDFAGTTIVLDGSGSKDPDDPSNLNGNMEFLWDCRREDYPAPCWVTEDRGIFSNLNKVWSINTTALQVGKLHSFNLTIVKGGRQETLLADVRRVASGTPTGTITRDCGTAFNITTGKLAPLACPAKHSPAQLLVLKLTLNGDLAKRDVSAVVWSTTTDGVRITTDASDKYLAYVKPGDMPASGNIVILAQLTSGGLTGTARMNLPLNSPPICKKAFTDSSNDCFEVVIVSDEFPISVFEASISAMDAGEDSLSFGFGVVRGKECAYFQFGPRNKYVYDGGFSRGNYTLCGCAENALGAKLCQTEVVTVRNSTRSTAELLTQLDSFNLTAAQAKNDPTVLANVGRTFAAIAQASTVALDPDQKTALSGVLGAIGDSIDTSNAAAALQSLSVMASLTGALFKTSDNAAPQAPSAALSNQLLAATSSILEAAAGSGKSLSSSQVSDLTDLLSKGMAGKAAQANSDSSLSAADKLESARDVARQVAQVATLFASSAQLGQGSAVAGSGALLMQVERNTADGFAQRDSGAASSRRLLAYSNSSTFSFAYVGTAFADWCTNTSCGAFTEQLQENTGSAVNTIMLTVTNKDSLAGLIDPAASNAVVESAVLDATLNIRSGLVCEPGNCLIELGMRLNTFNTSKLYKCIRLDSAGNGDYRATTANVTTVSVTATWVTCRSNTFGRFMVASYSMPSPPPPALLPPSPPTVITEPTTTTKPPPPSPPAAATKFVTFKLKATFNMDFASISNNITGFAKRVQTAILTTFQNQLLPEWVVVDNVRAASVAVDITLKVPQEWSAKAQDTINSAKSNPKLLFAADPDLANSATSLETVSSKKSSNGALIGGVVGGVVGGAVVVGGVAAFLIYKKRQASQNVQPSAPA